MATKSSVISGMGVAMSVVQSLVGAVRKNGGTDDDIHRLTTEDANGVWDKIAKLVIETGKKFGEVFTLVVNYSRSLKDSIAAGRYDWVNSDITEEHFPVEADEKETKEQSFTLYHFGKNMESDDVIAAMEKDGKRPATVRELLAFGEVNPELQRQFPIIALKSVWVVRLGNRRVACLGSDSVKRGLYLSWFDFGWSGDCRFLAVSK